MHREKAIADGRAYRARNRAQVNAALKRWAARNTEKRAATVKKWNAANPALVRAKLAKYRAVKLRATPPWADLKAIEAIYAEAVAKGLHVDHIVPLQGRTVCGLHVPWNLQLLTKSENSRKNNSHD